MNFSDVKGLGGWEFLFFDLQNKVHPPRKTAWNVMTSKLTEKKPSSMVCHYAQK